MLCEKGERRVRRLRKEKKDDMRKERRVMMLSEEGWCEKGKKSNDVGRK